MSPQRDRLCHISQAQLIEFTFIAVFVLAVRFSVMLEGYLATGPARSPGLVRTWSQWDSRAYLTLAAGGYRASEADPQYRLFLSHFPPLYPILIRVVNLASGAPLAGSGLAVSLTAITLASYLLYRLVLLDFGDRRAAEFSVAFLNVFPTSYFANAVYSESLFLLLVIGGFFLLRQGRLAASAWASSAAILTRLMGVTLVPSYLISLLRERPVPLRRYFTLVLPVLAVAAYLAINAAYFGKPFYFLEEYTTDKYSHKLLTVPFRETFSNLPQTVRHVAKGELTSYFMMTMGWGSLFTALALVLTAIGARWMPLEYSVYALSTLLFFNSFNRGISNARYTFAVFPMYIVLGRSGNTLVKVAVLALFLFLLFPFSGIFASGSWAF